MLEMGMEPAVVGAIVEEGLGRDMHEVGSISAFSSLICPVRGMFV